MLLEVPTGIVADRFGRRWSLILAAATLVVAETGFLLARDYPTFVLVQVVAGLSFALASGSRDALVYESLPPDNRTERMHQANGRIGAATQTGNLIAFATGGFLVAGLTVGRISAAIVLTIYPAIAVALFCLQWGAILVAPPLLSGYTNALIPDGYRATALSLISLFVSLYLVVMAPILGAIAGVSVAASFAVMGVLVLAGAVAARLDDPDSPDVP